MGHPCDVPKTTVDAVLDKVLSLKPDHLFWSGDNTAHDDPFVSQDIINEELKDVADIVAAKLGEG